MPTETQSNTEPKTVASFGNGRYSRLAQNTFELLMKHFKLDERKAQHVANAVASEIGAHMRNCPVVVKLGSISDGRISISEAAKLKGVIVTNNILALKAVSWINDAGMNGVSYQETNWKPIAMLQEYFDSL